jgi:hypothetical protein
MPRLRRWIFRDVTDLLLVKRAEKDGWWRVVPADRMAARLTKKQVLRCAQNDGNDG